MAITLDGTNGVISPGINLNTVNLSANPAAGLMENSGTSLFYTPAGTQRGLLPGQQMYVLGGTGVVGQNAIGNQNTFGVGVTLSSSTVYAFESRFTMIKTAGVTSHTFQTAFGGTATLNSILYQAIEFDANGTLGTRITVAGGTAINTATAATLTGALTAATQVIIVLLKGVVSINAGGTLVPQYTLSAAPGGAYTTQPGSYFFIYPVGTGSLSTTSVAIGNWS